MRDADSERMRIRGSRRFAQTSWPTAPAGRLRERSAGRRRRVFLTARAAWTSCPTASRGASGSMPPRARPSPPAAGEPPPRRAARATGPRSGVATSGSCGDRRRRRDLHPRLGVEPHGHLPPPRCATRRRWRRRACATAPVCRGGARPCARALWSSRVRRGCCPGGAARPRAAGGCPGGDGDGGALRGGARGLTPFAAVTPELLSPPRPPAPEAPPPPRPAPPNTARASRSASCSPPPTTRPRPRCCPASSPGRSARRRSRSASSRGSRRATAPRAWAAGRSRRTRRRRLISVGDRDAIACVAPGGVDP